MRERLCASANFTACLRRCLATTAEERCASRGKEQYGTAKQLLCIERCSQENEAAGSHRDQVYAEDRPKDMELTSSQRGRAEETSSKSS